MEFQVKDNTFYVLLNKDIKANSMMIFSDLTPSVKKVKEFLKNGAKTETLELMSINYKSENFEIKTIPWNIIAMELIKE
jgi:hypothetical protein